jgi:hypothetical protein
MNWEVEEYQDLDYQDKLGKGTHRKKGALVEKAAFLRTAGCSYDVQHISWDA